VEQYQIGLCERIGASFQPSPLWSRAGVAANLVPGAWPINGLRHPATPDSCGWYLWAGETLHTDEDFFQPLHVEHLLERSPAVMAYLGLPAGWRFLLAPDHEDVWFDPTLLVDS
jgi:hypothetical protein